MTNVFFQVLEQSFLFFPLVLAVYLSFNILKIPDLSVEGSFVTGASVFARLLHLEQPYSISILIALLSGAFIGLLVAFIQKDNRINPLITGVMMVFILSSLNLFIMGRPNLSLLNYETPLQSLLSAFPGASESFLTLGFIGSQVLLLTLLLVILLKSHYGLLLRAFGDNPTLLKRLGKNPEFIRRLGLALSNLLAAYCGILFSQVNAYADINMGFGFALVAIATLVLGIQIKNYFFSFNGKNLFTELFMIFLGVFIYFLFIHLFLKLNLNPNALKMLVGLSLITFLVATKNNRSMEFAI
jgi:putative tryptophan/tyrosine transport system permease protein